jgi:hypothetical protein
MDCSECNLAHGFRYAAIETDRPGVPPGNEHAIRVNISVIRRPQMTSTQELLARRLLLPALLVGFLPITEQAQRISAVIKSDPTRGEPPVSYMTFSGTTAWRPPVSERAPECSSIDVFLDTGGTIIAGGR